MTNLYEEDLIIPKEFIPQLVDCMGEAIAGLGIADDADEVVGCRLETDNNLEDIRKWCEAWDAVIAFHNKHCSKDACYSQPWMVKELDDQLRLR